MSKQSIKVLAGDRIKVEMSPYDLTKGRITFRHIDKSAPHPGGANRTYRR